MVYAHWLLQVAGDYTDSALAGEGWQFGIRYRCATGAVQAVGDLPNDAAIDDHDVNRDETNWTITGNWDMKVAAITFNADDWLNDQVAPAIATLFGYPDISSKARVRTLKCYPIGTNGKAIPAAGYTQGTPMLLTYKSGSQPVGGGSGSLLPLQNSIVASFQTAQVGRKGRGRVYAPAVPASAVNAVGELSDATQTEWATIFAEFLTNTNYTNITGVHIDAIVTGSPYQKYGRINAVRVGEVVDTQRRRRRQLAENYISVSV